MPNFSNPTEENRSKRFQSISAFRHTNTTEAHPTYLLRLNHWSGFATLSYFGCASWADTSRFRFQGSRYGGGSAGSWMSEAGNFIAGDNCTSGFDPPTFDSRLSAVSGRKNEFTCFITVVETVRDALISGCDESDNESGRDGGCRCDRLEAAN